MRFGLVMAVIITFLLSKSNDVHGVFFTPDVFLTVSTTRIVDKVRKVTIVAAVTVAPLSHEVESGLGHERYYSRSHGCLQVPNYFFLLVVFIFCP